MQYLYVFIHYLILFNIISFRNLNRVDIKKKSMERKRASKEKEMIGGKFKSLLNNGKVQGATNNDRYFYLDSSERSLIAGEKKLKKKLKLEEMTTNSYYSLINK